MSLTLLLTAVGADARVLEEKEGNVLYSGSDVPINMVRDFIVSVKVESSDGDTIYYRFEVTDFEVTKHTVTMEAYYTEDPWFSGPYPPFENRRDFHSGASHAGDIKIENDEYGYYGFVWMNEGIEKCTLDYTIGVKDSSSVDFCNTSIAAVLASLVLFFAFLIKRKG